MQTSQNNNSPEQDKSQRRVQSAPDMRQSVLKLVAEGFKVIPLCNATADGRCGCGRGHKDKAIGKVPLTDHGLKDCTQTQLGVKEYWAKYPQANIGIVTDGLIVLDFDAGHGGLDSKNELEAKYGPLPRTRKHRTGGGGQHWLYRAPNGVVVRNTTGLAGYQGIDTRANGGYIVAPPSLHPSGNRYEVLDDCDITLAPEWLVTLATQRSTAPLPPPGDIGQVIIPEGQRNAHLTSLAGSMRHRGMPQVAIEAALLETNATLCQPPLPEGEVLTIARSVSRYKPVKATRAGPIIVVNNRQLRDTTNDTLSALYKSNKAEPKVFQRGGNLVRVSIDEKQNPYIDPLTESSLRGLLTRAADFIKVNTNAKGEVVETKVSPPLDVVRDILSLREWQLSPLLTIIEVPVICSDGTIIDKIGYDTKTCLYYHPSPELRVPPVPDTPAESDVKAAKALLLEVICNFPFDSKASGANAVAAMLTPIVRPMIDGLVPLAVFDKPQPGSGASLLADVIAFIATGQTAGMLGGQRKEEEWRKAITTILLYGRSVICIDNIDGDLNSTSLSTVLTARVWRDRILGRNEEVLLPNMSTWIANGNNIRLAGDLPRRAYRARLDAQLAQPWLRRPSEFKHPDLIKWVRQKRGDIIAAMLTVARSWVVAGKPVPQDLVTIGSYESFCEVLGGILSFMEVKGFLGNLQQMYSEMDVETPQWGSFLEVWQELFGDSGVTVAEITKKLNENEGFAATLPDSLADKEEKGYSRKLGGALAKRKDVRFPNGLMIQAGKIKHHATAWKVVKAETKLPLFSFGGELGESGSTRRVCEDEKENDKDKYIDREWVHPNSPNSPLASKRGELAKNNLPEDIPDYPTHPCTTCGCGDYWLTDDNRWLCVRCHPRPQEIDMEI